MLADVEPLVREYEECAVAQAPGAGLAIGFDAETGFVGGSEAAARTSGLLDQLESVMDGCDAELAFQASIDAYAQKTSKARDFGTRGLMQPQEADSFSAADHSSSPSESWRGITAIRFDRAGGRSSCTRTSSSITRRSCSIRHGVQLQRRHSATARSRQLGSDRSGPTPGPRPAGQLSPVGSV